VISSVIKHLCTPSEAFSRKGVNRSKIGPVCENSTPKSVFSSHQKISPQ